MSFAIYIIHTSSPAFPDLTIASRFVLNLYPRGFFKRLLLILCRGGQDRHPYLENLWWSNDDVWKFRPFCLLLLVSSSSMLIHCLGGMIQFYRPVVVHPRKQQGLKQHRSPCNNEDKEPTAQPPAVRSECDKDGGQTEDGKWQTFEL